MPSVSDKAGSDVAQEVPGAAMARVLNLRDVLELVNDRLDDGSFARENLVQQVHELVLHVAFELGEEFDVLVKECLKEQPRDVTAVGKDLAPQPVDKFWHRYAVINIARSETAGQVVRLRR